MNIKMHRNMPSGAKIIAANHPSTTDPFFVAAMVRSQSYILINDLLFQVPILGEYLHRSGHIPVKVGEGQQAIDSAIAYLKAGKTVMIFPEGALSPGKGEFHAARTGVARLAIASGAPVIPVGIHLMHERIHSIRSVVNGKVEYGQWYLTGPYSVTVGRPMRFAGDLSDRQRVRNVANIVMHHIIELAHESEDRYHNLPGSLKKAVDLV